MKKIVSAVLTAALFGTMLNLATFADEVSTDDASGDKTRIVYSQNFDDCTWWENGNEPAAAEFERTPFFKAMDDGEKMQSTYEIVGAANGRAADDKSLHINQKFNHGFGNSGTGDLNCMTEDNMWVGNGSGSQGTNGVSHRITLDSGNTQDSERYLHISFSAAQNYKQSSWIDGEQGSGLDVSFVFNTNKGEQEKEMLHWYNYGCQGVFGKFYTVGMKENKWISYDYVVDKEALTEKIYVNGYCVAERPLANEIDRDGTPAINGISKLNFQVRDTNLWGPNRDTDVYLDDIKVEYSEEQPEVSAYSVFGEAAYINAPEKYVDKETGIIYNCGQTLTDMKQYMTGKNVYLVKYDSEKYWPELEQYDSESLDSVALNDGRTGSPILFAEDDYFTYRYIVKQPRTTAIKAEAAVIQDGIKLSWTGQSDKCRGIEIFRNGELVVALAKDAAEYTDNPAITSGGYEYTIRELLSDSDVATATETDFADADVEVKNEISDIAYMVTGAGEQSAKVNASVNVNAKAGFDSAVNLIAALYKDNRLFSVKASEAVSLSRGEEKTIEVSLEGLPETSTEDDNVEVKFFLWDANMKPVKM